MKLENLKEFELNNTENFSVIYGGSAALMADGSRKKDVDSTSGDSYKKD